MDLINSLYETIPIYRSLIITKCVHESDIISELLVNNDYSITFSIDNKNARIFISTLDDLPYEHLLNNEEYNVIFISKTLKNSIDTNKMLSSLPKAKVFAFIEIDYKINIPLI